MPPVCVAGAATIHKKGCCFRPSCAHHPGSEQSENQGVRKEGKIYAISKNSRRANETGAWGQLLFATNRGFALFWCRLNFVSTKIGQCGALSAIEAFGLRPSLSSIIVRAPH